LCVVCCRRHVKSSAKEQHIVRQQSAHKSVSISSSSCYCCCCCSVSI